MAPYNFDAPDADAILRSSDGKELRVHRLILSLSSPVFQGMFSLPSRPTDPVPTIDVADPSDILERFVQYLYPKSPPNITDVSMWAVMYAIADKYNAEIVTEHLRGMLIPRFLEASPLRVYALASHWGFEEEAKIASRGTLDRDIFEDFPREDAELMGGIGCQRLLFLHFNRREAARGLVVKHPLPPSRSSPCTCPPPNYDGIIPALARRMGSTPRLTSEELLKEIPRWKLPKPCTLEGGCRYSVANTCTYFSSLLESIYDLPQTI